MKKKTYPPEREQLLSFRIVNAIVASPLLEDEEKLLALEDLRQMYSEPEYFNECVLSLIPLGEEIQPDLAPHHLWCKSRLGEEFWDKINQIIGRV